MRDMTVHPTGVKSRGRACLIEAARLRDEHKWLVWYTPVVDVGFGSRDVFVAAADVHRGRIAADLRTPRNRRREGKVHLECSRAVAKPLELPLIGRGEPSARDAKDLTRRQIEEHRPRGRNVGERADRHAGVNFTAIDPRT